MSHAFDKHYNDFGGLDTRTNKLMQNSKFARGGKNFQYTYQDENAKAHGFQHRMTSDFTWGLMEYRFRDPNTGEARNEILGIDASGNLKKIVYQYLKFTISGGSVAKYSLYYDEAVPSWVIRFYDSSDTLLNSQTFSILATLQNLSTAINALAITGLTTSVVDADGVVTAVGNCLAYQLPTTILTDLPTGDTLAQGFFAETITSTQTPAFPTVVSQASNPDYEGPTWQNHNNCIYITDGGFPMKYDGKAVYRAGLPESLARDPGGDEGSTSADLPGFGTGFNAADDTTPSNVGDLPDGTYNYIFRFAFRDLNGAIYYGNVDKTIPYTATIGASESPQLYIPSLKPNTSGFAIFSAKVNGTQSFPSTQGSTTITVDSGHNIVAGMSLMIGANLSPSAGAPAEPTTIGYLKYWSAQVTSVTATSITIASHPLSFAGDGIFSRVIDNQVITAYYAPLIDQDKALEDLSLNSAPPYGFFVQIFRSPVNQSDTFYKLAEVAMPATTSQEYVIYDNIASALTESFDDQEPGAALPRACRYLSRWQNTLVQSGRPYESADLRDTAYPSFYRASDYADYPYFPVKYSESSLCDFQSIYWASQDAPEGFPQDGLNEFLIDTPFNDEIRGMAANKDSFFAFKERSTGYLTGSLATNEVALEVMEVDAGCACHKAVQEVQGAIFYMDSNAGFWSIVAGRLPQFIGYCIEDYFKENRNGFNFRRAIATNFRADDKFLCYIPGDNPIMFAYDYAATPTGQRTAWYPWDMVDAGGGLLATSEDQLLVASKDSSLVWEQKHTNTKYDFSVHESGIDYSYIGSWLNYGYPTIYKKFHNVWINSIQGGFDLIVTQFANFLSPAISTYTMTFLPESASKKGVKNWVNCATDKMTGFSVGFSNNTIYADVRIQGWEVEYSPDFDVNEGRK